MVTPIVEIRKSMNIRELVESRPVNHLLTVHSLAWYLSTKGAYEHYSVVNKMKIKTYNKAQKAGHKKRKGGDQSRRLK